MALVGGHGGGRTFVNLESFWGGNYSAWSNIKFENQLADLETLFTICKVQFNKDRYKIVPVIQSNPKCKC